MPAEQIAYLVDADVAQMRQPLFIVAGGVVGIAVLLIAFGLRQRRGQEKKKKRG